MKFDKTVIPRIILIAGSIAFIFGKIWYAFGVVFGMFVMSYIMVRYEKQFKSFTDGIEGALSDDPKPKK